MVQISSEIGGNRYCVVTRYGRDTMVTRVVTPDPRQARNAVRTLRRSLARFELPNDVFSEAARALDEIEDEFRFPDPDRGVITARLEGFTELLTDAGSLASNGDPLIRPIRAIAAWLGPIAAPLLGQLA